MISRAFSFLFSIFLGAIFLILVVASFVLAIFLWSYLGSAPSMSQMTMTQAVTLISIPVVVFFGYFILWFVWSMMAESFIFAFRRSDVYLNP